MAEKKKKNTKKAAKSEKKGLSKSAKTLIIAAVAVVVLIGIFLLVYYLLPQQDDPKDTTNTDSVWSDYLVDETTPSEYPLVIHVPADIEKIEVDNETGKYTLISETPTTEVTASDGTVSTSTEATVYTLVGYEDKELLAGSPDTLANDAAALTASKIVNDGSKKSDFGFDSPRATVKTTFKGGDTATVVVGADAPDNQGAYVMIEGDDNVYLVTSDAVDGYLIGAMGMISNEIGFAADDESGNVFTKMVFGGTLFGEDVTFEYSNSDNFSETYRITSPDDILANEEVVTYMINNVRSLTAKEVEAVDPDDSKLKEYGLDTPYVTVSAEYPDLKVDYKTSKPDSNGDFHLLSDGIVYKMSTDSVPWVLHDYSECVVKKFLSPKYGSVEKITVNADGKDYTFDITSETTTSADGSTDITTNTIKCNGVTIDETKFDVYYQNLTSAERSGGSEAKPDGKKQTLSVTLTYADGTTTTADFFEATNRKSPVVINGSYSTLAYESYVTKILEDTPKIASNESVTSVY